MVTVVEMLGACASRVDSWGPMFCAGAMCGAVLALRRPAAPWVAPAMLGAALGAGVLFAWSQLALVDDAYISLRYADNWNEGRGLVWNRGEAVLGITNLGWTVLLAVAHVWTDIRLEYLALLGCGISFVGVVATTAAISKALHGDGGSPWWPVAACLVAVQYTVTAFASTGLETMGVAWLTLLGVYAMVRLPGPYGAGLAGVAWIAATVVRMDHAVFYAVGAVWVAARHLSGARTDPRERAALVAYALPFLGWVAVASWTWSVYGDVLPNTYYAKSADLFYGEQGLVYGLSFLVGSRLWLVLPLMLAWPMWAARSGERSLALYAVGAVSVVCAYVVKVGGDFMFGRFFVTVIPLVLLGAESVALQLLRRKRWVGVAAFVVLGATLRGGSLLGRGEVRWHLADENTVYRIDSVVPLKVDHHHFHNGHRLGELRDSTGLDLAVATSGIGMVGFYSGLEMVDLRGLTDAVVAHQPLAERGRPGHEKMASTPYLDRRQVVVMRGVDFRPKFKPLRRVRGLRGDWYVRRYDEAQMRAVRDNAPFVHIPRFRKWMRQFYLPTLDDLSADEIEEDLADLDRYFWDVNGHDDVRAGIVAALEDARAQLRPEVAELSPGPDPS